VSRLTDQKGTDIISAALGRILEMGAQVVILGSGDRRAEDFFKLHSHHGGDRFRAYIGFSEPLSHKIEAGSDLFLMPSRFEPCGLNQMYSLRYGTVPVVREVGGLADTVRDADRDAVAGNGFTFGAYHPGALLDAALTPQEIATVTAVIDRFRSPEVDFHGLQTRGSGRQRFVAVHVLFGSVVDVVVEGAAVVVGVLVVVGAQATTGVDFCVLALRPDVLGRESCETPFV